MNKLLGVIAILLTCFIITPTANATQPSAITPAIYLAEAAEEDLFGQGDDLFSTQGDDLFSAQDDSLFGAEDSLDAGAEQPTDTADAELDLGGDIDLFSDLEIDTSDVVEVPPEKSKLYTVGGPLALFLFYFFIIWLNRVTVPFVVSKESITLYHYPTGVKRGLAIALCLYGVAFVFGASEIAYQLELYGDGATYFEQMSLGKIIAFTHAHLFGFTTSFLIIGIPFSMQFNHIRWYQMVFPAGLAAAVVDVMSWWGIKYLHPNYEYVSVFCGIVFSLTYLFMLLALLRVLLFPQIIFISDKDRDERLEKRREKLRESREKFSGEP